MTIVQCPGCGFATDNVKQFCGNCGTPLQGQAPKQPAGPVVVAARQTQQMTSTGRTALIVGAVVFVVLFALFFWACSACSGPSRSDEVTYTMAAADLAAEYDANEVAADAAYEGKTLSLSGIVEDVGTEIMGHPYVMLEGGVQAVCADDQKDAVAGLVKGDAVTVTGACNGKLGWVLMDDCVLE